MLSRLSIGMKIFGLAVLLLTLTVALAGFLLWHINHLKGEMQVIAQREVPLAAAMANLEEYGLLRGLAFERWFGELNASRPNAEIIKEAEASYTIWVGRLDQEVLNAGKLLDFPVQEGSSPGKGRPNPGSTGKDQVCGRRP